MNNHHIIEKVLPDSIAEELGIESGDKLLSINNQKIRDIFDYYYQVENEEIVLLIEKLNNEEWELEIEKGEDDELGLVFSQSLMDEYRSCKNKCIFCFIDQMPKGMRDTLYFKDDDSRLSFLQGNYITLTNMTDDDIDRIIRYRLEPVNISIHTTNSKLRCKMLNNTFAGKALKYVKRLYKGKIAMNGQIVLCKGVNDGKELVRTLNDLTKYLPYLKSVSIVPVGITKYREGLFQMEVFTKKDAKNIIDLIRKYQEKNLQTHGLNFVHGADEWYILAEEDLPSAATYDDYPQIENGVGMLRLFIDEVNCELEKRPGDHKERNIALVTGTLAAPYLYSMCLGIQMKYPGTNIDIHPIRNDFFGETITVSGLVTGQDIINQLTNMENLDKLLIPCNMLRDGEEVFLDDVTVNKLSEALKVKVEIVGPSGKDFIEAVAFVNSR